MRRGFVLPVVILCGTLIAIAVYGLHAVTTSDYGEVHRDWCRYQQAALADLALDEVFIRLHRGVDSGGQAAWVAELLDQLEQARVAAAAVGKPVTVLDLHHAPIDLSRELELTKNAASKATVPFTISAATASLGPFRVLGGWDPKAFYNEPLFGDGAKDLVPWDLRGSFKVDLTIELPALGQSERFVREQDLAITDTTAPACEFALFSYLASPDEDYALNDLQRGGRLSIHPTARPDAPSGRVMVRGPLLLLPEDAADDKTFLAPGGHPTSQSMSYPEDQGQWTGWAAVPGPRALHPPQGEGTFRFLLWSFSTAPGELRRPSRDQSPSPLPGPFRVTVLGYDLSWPPALASMSLVLAFGSDLSNPSWYVDLWPGDEIGHYPPGSYLYGFQSRGKQAFSLLGEADGAPPAPGGATSRGVYQGAHLFQDPSHSPEPYRQGLGLPDGQDGESILPEPVPSGSGQGLRDTGILALYGSARFDSRTLHAVTLLEVLIQVLVDMIPGADSVTGVVSTATFGTVDAKKAAKEVLEAGGIDPGIELLLRKHKTTALASVPAPMTSDGLEDLTKNKQGIVVPYGLYCYGQDFWQQRTGLQFHGAELWNSVRQKMQQQLSHAAKQAANNLLGNVLGQAFDDDVIVQILEGAAGDLENAYASAREQYESFFADVSTVLDGYGTSLLKQLGDEANVLDQAAAVQKLLHDDVTQRSRTWRDLAEGRVLRAAGAFGPRELPFSDQPAIKEQVAQFLGAAQSGARAAQANLQDSVTGAIGQQLSEVANGASDGGLGALSQAQQDLGREAGPLLDSVRDAIDNPAGRSAAAATDAAPSGANRANNSASLDSWSRDFKDGAQEQIGKYGRGFFPPKYRKWEGIATRSYPDFQTYLNSETGADGVLELKGAVLLRDLHYSGPALKYRGRGILIVVTEAGATSGPLLDAEVRRADPSQGLMILAHSVSPELMRQASRPPLMLGPVFEGSVFSDSGVAPAPRQPGCVIVGNLVTGLLNKSAIRSELSGPNQGVHVCFDPKLAEAASGSRKPYWTVELAGEVASSGAPELKE